MIASSSAPPPLLAATIPAPAINTVHCIDALELLKRMPSQSVNCIVTSPPYFGLRDYGVPGQIGLEETPQQFVAKLVELFREAKRVLRDDGVMFLNLGDSYFGSSMTGGTNGKEGSSKREGRMFTRPSNGQRATSYGTSGKEPEGYQDHGCLCGNLCDVCRVVYQNRKSHNDDLLVAMLTASLSAPNHECKVLSPDHSPTLGLVHQEAHNEAASQDFAHSQAHANEQLRAFLVSMIGESYPQLLDVCLLRDSLSECLLCARSLTDYAQVSVHKSGDSSGQFQHNSGNVPHDDQRVRRSQYIDKACEYCGNVSYSPLDIQPHCTTYNLKPKDLLGIPWRVAFALQDDGWILRSEIIWAKPNPMPESVTDRPTKAHETIFLFAKSQKYFYDADAIREPSSENSHGAPNPNPGDKQRALGRALGKTTLGQTPAQKNLEVPGRSTHSMHSERANGNDYTRDMQYRNKRTVWTVTTEAFEGAHFATFPTKLIEPMILAGCPDKTCAKCGAPWIREVEVSGGTIGKSWVDHSQDATHGVTRHGSTKDMKDGSYQRKTLGFKPTCDCNADTRPGVVYDPFMGSGTTALVARKFGRSFIGSELNPEYAAIAKERLRLPFEAHHTKASESTLDDLPLFKAIGA